MSGPERVDTRVVAVDAVTPEPAAVDAAARLLRQGRLVAFPTETVYGLGANALDEAAVGRIFAAKERDPDDPLIVHIAGRTELHRVARAVPPVAAALAEVFWPGGLTLVLPRKPEIAPAVSAGRETVAVRVPSHPVAHAVIAAAGIPVAAPSANRFMRTSATAAQHVLDDLGGRIDMVLDGGHATAGIESTVVAVDGGDVTLLRPGAVSVERIEEVLGHPLRRAAAPVSAASSPGMMERHYAPRARLVYLPGTDVDALIEAARDTGADGQRAGLLLADGDGESDLHGLAVERLGPVDDLDVVASRLFAAMRALDAAGVDVIYARGFPHTGAGLAIHDRLRRASAP